MKILCVGRNYVEHIEELQNERPEEPVLFSKPETARLINGQDFYIPEFSKEIHYEVEVLIKISKVGKYIQPKFAKNYYDKIGLGIDFTARDIQRKLKEKGLPWEKAKAFDGSAVIGQKWWDKTDFKEVQDIGFSLWKNDKLVQQGNTKLMLWGIDELIAEISKYFTLKMGDVIFTGTPAGVGPVQIGDQLVGKLSEETAFKVNVR